MFGQEVSIPEATSFTKHGTIIRASTIPEVPCPPCLDEIDQQPVVETKCDLITAL